MMPSLQPTELLNLVRFTRTPRANEARPREKLTRCCAETLPPYTAFAEWMPTARKQYVWVTSSDKKIRAVAGLRPRAGKDVWEIDTLLMEPDSAGLCTELLERVGVAAGSRGIQRVFLRLCGDSPLAPEAIAAGFSAYQKERLMCACPPRQKPTPDAPSHQLRPRAACDDYPLFRLYEATAPSAVRMAEGMTLPEWKASREKGWGRGRSQEFVCEKEGQLAGWLRLTDAGDTGYIDALARPVEDAVMKSLMDFGVAQLTGKQSLLSLVRDGDTILIRILEERGFGQREEYVTLVKHSAERVRAPCLIPAGA